MVPKQSQMHVIYAEDEEFIRNTLATFLKKMLFPNLHVVTNGLEAIEKFKELYEQGTIVDLVITDITMPEVDGFEFIEESRKLNEDLFALVISGLDFGPYFKKINSISVRTQYLIKPIDLHTLLEKVNEIIGKIEANKILRAAQTIADQYKIAIDNSATISKTDVDGNITYVNDKFCEITGYTRDELIGQNHRILKSHLVDDSLFDEMWETISSKKIYKCENLPNKAKDGTIYYINTTIVPILNVKGDIDEYLSIRFDNTAVIKSLEEEKKAKEMQALFLANMSHEIRTPLNAIIGFTKLLNESPLNEEDKNYVQIVNDNAHHLVDTIGEILDFSKIRSGSMELENIYFNAFKEINSIRNLFDANASSKNVLLKANIDAKLEDLEIFGDVTKLKQVISNLLSNAIKFTPSGGKVTINVNVEKAEDDEAIINFSVKDNGIGIDKDKQEDIFKPFTQENQSTTRQYGGTGLGLSICKEIIALMGSELKVHSKKDSGSMFYFRLETKYKLKHEGSSETPAQKETSKDLVFKNVNVLVAEDVEINQKLLNALLKKVNINANFVFNGQEALDYFNAYHEDIDMILLDINMPVMDGEEALKNLLKLQKQYGTTIPVLALTANAVKGDKERFISLGFDNYISKPINFDLLFSSLKYYLKDKLVEANSSKEKKTEIEAKKEEVIQESEETQIIEINLEEIANNLSLPYEFYLELLDDFKNVIDTEIDILRENINKNSTELTHNQAHKLKGLCGNLGFKDLYDLFKELETFESVEKSLEQLNKAIKIINIIKEK